MESAKILDINTFELIPPILQWADTFSYVYYSQPRNVEKYPYGGFKPTLIVSNNSISIDQESVFDSLSKLIDQSDQAKLYGFLTYELQEETHGIHNPKPSTIAWPKAGFFEAEYHIHLENDCIVIEGIDAQKACNSLKKFLRSTITDISQKEPIQLKSNTSKEAYINTVNALRGHIEEGDVYEINYCMNYEAEVGQFNPITTYLKLSEKSPTPFNVLLKWEDKYALCASPERFLKLQNNKLISQPIKGTAQRASTPALDEEQKNALRTSEKERAENMMIVDLVRNDLTLSSKTGSIQVEEIFGIYSFEYVHQMISTITSQLKEGLNPVASIKNAFPMGSMTGAPKKSALELIKRYETHQRTLFSGSIGHMNTQEFDFNVVIRSLFYDQQKKVINYQVGSAITYDSDPEKEYEECQLKAQAIIDILKD